MPLPFSPTSSASGTWRPGITRGSSRARAWRARWTRARTRPMCFGRYRGSSWRGRSFRSARTARRRGVSFAIGEARDQAYVLAPIPRERLARAVFPLGEYRKTEVREIADRRGLAVAFTPESQDICFIPDGDYRRFVRKTVAAEPGDVVDGEGSVLGRHAGVVDFTVGQRRGIGVSAPTPLYVTEVRPKSKQVVVGRRKDLEIKTVRVGGLNRFLPMEEARAVQVRYNSGPVLCRVEKDGEGWVAHLEEPVMGVAAGQSAVVYAGGGERVVAGGVGRRGGA